MIVYKLDKTNQKKASEEIKDMGAVLSEIAPTLRILQDLLAQHQQSLYEQNINQYRDDLLNMTSEAIRLTHLISVNSQRLHTVSDQVSKHLGTLDEQISNALQGRGLEPIPQPAKEHPANRDIVSKTNRSNTFGKVLSRA
ncbi:hypothetical protein BH23PAT1_BH23PAT1_4900 [soil metagenome]